MKPEHSESILNPQFTLDKGKYMDLYHGISFHRIRFWELERTSSSNKNWILCVNETCYTKKLTGLEGLPLPIYILGVVLNMVSSTVSLVIEQFLNEKTRGKTLHLLGISGVIAVMMYILNGLGFPMYFTGLVALFFCIFVILGQFLHRVITFNYSEFFANIIANAMLKVQNGAVDVASGTVRKAQGHLSTAAQRGYNSASTIFSNVVSEVLNRASPYTTNTLKDDLPLEDNVPIEKNDELVTGTNADYGDSEVYDKGWFSYLFNF